MSSKFLFQNVTKYFGVDTVKNVVINFLRYLTPQKKIYMKAKAAMALGNGNGSSKGKGENGHRAARNGTPHGHDPPCGSGVGSNNPKRVRFEVVDAPET